MLGSGLSSEAKAAKKIYVSARATGYYTASISWNKISKPQSGYALFRDGVVIAHFGKKTTSYSDAGLAAGSYHTYQVKAYKKKTTKKKMWRNKYTGELRKKRPKKGKKDWKKKTIKTVKYTYKKSSNVASVSTPAKPASTAPATKPVSGGGSGGGNTTPTTETKTVTNYLGNKTTVTTTGDGWLECVKEGSTQVTVKPDNNASWASLDRTVNGDFGNYRQIDGATFKLTGNDSITANLTTNNSFVYGGQFFDAYNVDMSKLSIEPSSGYSKETVRSYKWPYLYEKSKGTVSELEEVTKTYIVKNGKRIARLNSQVAVYNSSYQGINVKLYTDTDGGTGLIYNDTVSIDIKYNGKFIGTMTITPADGLTDNGMPALRRLALDICQSAIDWAASSEGQAYYSGKSIPEAGIYRDFRYIKDYMADVAGYKYDQSVSGRGTETGNLHCTMCAYILETWAVYKYGTDGLGFIAWGNSSSTDHVAYHLNNDPGYDGGEILLPKN
jgi:hypothetical protein